MNSFNHYAYGAIGDWMHLKMAGIVTYEDGVDYKHIKIKPHIGGNLTNVSAGFETYCGKIGSSWKVENDKIIMDIEIPANTSATIYVPAKNETSVYENGFAISDSKEIRVTETDDGYAVLKVVQANIILQPYFRKG